MATEAERVAIGVLQEQMRTTTKTLSRIESKVDDGFASLDKRYASKLSERIVYGLVAVILLFVLNGWLGLFKLPTIQVVAPGTNTSTTTTTPSGSTTTSTTPAAQATSHSDSTTPSDSQTDTSTGGVQVTIPKVDL